MSLQAPLFIDGFEGVSDIELPNPAQPERSVSFQVVGDLNSDPSKYFDYTVIDNTDLKSIKVQLSGFEEPKEETF